MCDRCAGLHLQSQGHLLHSLHTRIGTHSELDEDDDGVGAEALGNLGGERDLDLEHGVGALDAGGLIGILMV